MLNGGPSRPRAGAESPGGGITNKDEKQEPSITPWAIVLANIFDMYTYNLPSQQSKDEQRTDAVCEQLLLHRRFAAGQAFTPDFFGGMLGRIRKLHMLHI